MTLLQAVRDTIERHSLLEPGDSLVVGVSGGADSLCLLHLLARLRPEFDLALHVAHLNHQLRGEQAGADAEFVRRTAVEWGVPVTVSSADVATLAHERGVGVEEAARQARYAFLARLAGDTQTAYLLALGFDLISESMQDKVFETGECNMAESLVKILTSYYNVGKIYVMDAHFEGAEWMSKYPIVTVKSQEIIKEALRQDKIEDAVKIAPDLGSQSRLDIRGFSKKRINSFDVELSSKTPLENHLGQIPLLI